MYEVLKGVRVVEVAAWTFVPSAGAILADLGADVIKLEHPVGGDPQRGLFNALTPSGGPNPMMEVPNHGKRSAGVDIATPEGLTILHRLVEGADVFLTSFMNDARARLRIDIDDVRAINSRVIYARGSGYGPRGPDADKPGFDVASTWARGGIAHRMTSDDDDEPAMMPGSIGDLVGGLSIAGAVAAALYHRERTGEATEVDVSLYQVGMWMQAQAITAAPLGLGGPPMSRSRPMNPLVNPYRTRDGRWVWLCFLQPDRWWADFCRHLDREDLIADPRFCDREARQANRPECVAMLDEIFATRTLAEWCVALEDAEGVWAPVASAEEIAVDPQVHANDYFPEALAADGTTFRVVAAPMQFGGRGVGRLRGLPDAGAQTEEVLLELGFGWEEIVALKDRRAVQ